MKKKLFVFGLLLISLLCICSAASAAVKCHSCEAKGEEGVFIVTRSKASSCDYECNNCGTIGSTVHFSHQGPCEYCGKIRTCERGYIPNGDGTHAIVCAFVLDGEYPENCTLKPGAVPDEECLAGWPTCTEPGECFYCRGDVGEPDPNRHLWRKWQDDGNGNHFRICNYNSSHVETQPHTGGTATCVERAVCDVCNLEYGSVDLTAHDWSEWTADDEKTHTRACMRGNCDAKEEHYSHDFDFDCTVSGTCSVCGCVTQAQEHIPGPAATCITDQLCSSCGEVLNKKGSHVYGQWTANGDGTHSAACKRCAGQLTVACSLYELGDKTVCSICGEYGEAVFAAVEAGIKAVDYNALPKYGELIVRMLENPAADTAYGFTVAWESAGKEIPFSGVVSVSLPLQAEGQYKLMQKGTEIPFTMEEGVLTFETNEAGLFLLILQQ